MEKKLNNIEVQPIKLEGSGKKLEVKGAAMFSEPYANIFLVAKKKTGKTTVIYNIIKRCATKDTVVVAFVSTLTKDPAWIAIEKYCDDHDIPFVGYTSLIEDGEDQLESLIKSLQQPVSKDQAPASTSSFDLGPQKLIFNEEKPEKAPRKRKSKYVPLDYIIVLDDLSTELQSKSVISLLKKNRHFRCKLIISSQ